MIQSTPKPSLRRLIRALVALSLLLPARWTAPHTALAQAANTGLRSPTGDAPVVGVGNGGDGFEFNPTLAYTDDEISARNNNGVGDQHEFYDFGFESAGLPPDAIITGIEVRVDGRVVQILGAARYDVELSWNGSNNWTGSRSTSALTTNLATYMLGGPTDLWGRTAWTPNELSDANFSVRITSIETGPQADTQDFRLDWIAVNVYYDLSAENPSIAIAKTPDNQQVVSGGTVTFTIAVTNTGDVLLSNVAVADPLAPACAAALGTLAAGVSNTYTCARAGVAAGFTNTASVTGTSPANATVSASDTAVVSVINPGIAIAKTPDTQAVVNGGAANFTIAVTNTGDVALSNVVVSDALAPACAQTIGALGVGQSSSYACALTNVTLPFTNVATVTCSAPAGGALTASDSARVTVVGAGCPNGLFAYWKLDEAQTNPPAYADVFLSHAATCVGACPSPVAGRAGGAQNFNGSTTGLSVPLTGSGDPINWGAADSFTIEFWMQASTTVCNDAVNDVIVGREDRSSGQLLHWWVGIACDSGGKPAFVAIEKDGTEGILTGLTPLTDGAWHLVTAVRDAGQARNLLYVDDHLEASLSVTYNAGFDSPTAPLSLGWLSRLPPASRSYRYNDALDEVALYNRALSLSDVQAHFFKGVMAGSGYCAADVPIKHVHLPLIRK